MMKRIAVFGIIFFVILSSIFGAEAIKQEMENYNYCLKSISLDKDYRFVDLFALTEFEEVKIKVLNDGFAYKCGIADSDGNIIIPIIYDEVFPFSKGAYFVRNGDLKKVINIKGDTLFDLCKYDTVTVPKDGFVGVTINGKKGLILESGEEVFPCEYDELEYNLYLVWGKKDNNDGWRFFDKNGATKNNTVYDEIKCFRNISFNGCNYEFNKLFKVLKNGKYGVVNNTGNEVLPCIYHDVEICDNDIVAVFENGWKYINLNYNSSYYIGGLPYYFSEGYAPIYFDGKYGYINKCWKISIPCKYDVVSGFTNGIAYVKEDSDEYCRIIDKSGKSVIMSKGYAIVSKGDGFIGRFYPDETTTSFGPPKKFEAVVDCNGDKVTEFIYNDIQDFVNGVAVAYKSGIGYGLINKDGEEITPFMYEKVEILSDKKYCVVIRDESDGIYKIGILTLCDNVMQTDISLKMFLKNENEVNVDFFKSPIFKFMRDFFYVLYVPYNKEMSEVFPMILHK